MHLFPLLSVSFYLFNLSLALYTAVPRWAQAIAVINDTLFVYGGKTDQYNSYGYNSAPWSNDLLFLSLSTSFDPSNPPWQYISGSANSSISSQGPALAWHSLSAFNASTCLIFGGNTGPTSGIVLLDNSDSGQLLNVADRTAPSFHSFPNDWASEPQRRMRHATASVDGKIYIIGGEAADGSGNTFSTHFLFDPSVPTFIQLPSANAPPAIFGHAAVILFDGRLLVFGGISQGQLVPFSTIWVLNTTQSNLAWVLASVNTSNLPSPRAAFAVVQLDDGRILIQGGSDAAFQTNLADGWILDPSKSPMTWTPVPALSQVGPRRDHFAFNAAGQVVFGFGYGNNAPADAGMQVYNVGASSYQPTFSPMTAPPAHTTLPPDPSQTLPNSPGSSQTSGHGNPSQSGRSGSNTSSRTGLPSSTSTGGGGGKGPGNGGKVGGAQTNTTAIIIGAVLGALGLAVALALIAWYFRRRHARQGHAFSALDNDEDHPHSITAIRIGDRRKGPRILALPLGLLSMIGLARSRRHLDYSRRDILADEDRSINWAGMSREGSAGRSSGGPSARSSIRGFSNAVTGRLSSIRNLARGTGSAPRSREPSTVVDWEKMGGDPFSPEVALMADALARDELSERRRNGLVLAGPSQPYTDPFAERDGSSSSVVLHEYDSKPEPESNRAPERKEQPHPPLSRLAPLRTALQPSSDFVPLSPLLEQASQISLSNSSSSQHSNSDRYAGSGSGSSRGAARSPRPSSILDPNPPANGHEPIRRSNSWWMRFAKTPLLERRSTELSARNSGGFLDFRDPNPPPRLLPIEESAHSRGSSDVPAEGTRILQRPSPSLTANRTRSGTPTRKPSLYHETIHGRSASSLQTANTEMLEHLGGTMDIVQRDVTLDSQHTPLTGSQSLEDEFGAGSGGGLQQLRALLVHGERSYHSTRTGSSSVSSESAVVLSPFNSGAATPTGEGQEPTSPPLEETVVVAGAGAGSAEGSSVPEDGGPHSPGVAERVRAFERRMSRENALPPSPTNTRRREERAGPVQAVLARPSVRYGLVPRPSLFVANPDRSRGSDGG